MPAPASTRSSPPTGFAYSREQFQQYVADALAFARSLGASEAGAEVSEGVGLSVSVRKGEVENVERNRDKSLGVTVYVGQRRGNASTSDFSRAALEQTVRAAHDIARFTAEDPAAGLPETEDMALGEAARLDLDLYHPWAIDAEGAMQLALRCESAALMVDKRITNSEGAGVSAQQSHFFAGNSARLSCGGYASSRHSLSVAPIASTAGRNRAKAATTCSATPGTRSMRSASQDLAAPEAVGRYAAERALVATEVAQDQATCEVPVLFESTVAAGLLGAYVQATSGGALYRKSSFLLDSAGQAGAARAHRHTRRPAQAARQGQCAVRRRRRAPRSVRDVVKGGVVQGYFLSSYSARKLGMRTTGHAGGSQNLTLTSRLTAIQRRPRRDAEASCIAACSSSS